MKLCTECRFYTAPQRGMGVADWSRCSALIGAQSPVDGKPADGGFCSSARAPHGVCGPDAKHHEPAEVRCPKCNSDDTNNASGDAAGIDTHYLYCHACSHQWGHS